MTNNISPLGFGCYRVDYRIPQHAEALEKALTSGINLIDTSANYSDGGSEILVGNVVNDLIDENKLSRESITIVTKGGYIQGKNYKTAMEREKAGNPFPEVVKYGEGLWHCIHPEFLQDQIERQLERLKPGHIDVYLLHNPEYYLNWAKTKNIPVEEAREEYYRRIKAAFEFLESKVKEGLIGSYGISSNTFPVHAQKYDFTSLEKVFELASGFPGGNNFKFIQLPFNPVEAGAITIKNQADNSKTVLEFAEENNIKVLINRPLNAITAKGLVRLADFKADHFEEKDFIRQMKLVENMEHDIATEKIDEAPGNAKERLKKFLTAGRTISENWKFFGSIEHFNDTVEQYFFPRINYLMEYSDSTGNENIKEVFNEYINEVYKLLSFVSNYYKLRAEKRSQYLHNAINGMCDKKYHDLSLTRKVLLLLISVPGVNCILVGARRERYVDDIIPVINLEKIPDAGKIIKKISEEIEMASIQ
jgi:aryl-alcohol dehydrogenase-like predicted oxidoreductase